MKNSGRAFIVSLCIAGSVMTAPAVVFAGVLIDVDIAPPALRVEPVPVARPGFVWAPGYWEYRDHAHVWVGGRWIGERAGFRWAPDRWEQRGPHWHHVVGHWER
jgi:hypothetical protein